MGNFTFKAFAFGGELDLNRLAVKLGIIRKFRREEPMKLNPMTLEIASSNDKERSVDRQSGRVQAESA